MSTDAALLAAEGWFKRLAQGDTAWSAPFATVLLAEYGRLREVERRYLTSLPGGQRTTDTQPSGAVGEPTFAECDRLRARLARIAALHTQWPSSPYRLPSCAECREPWPCPTHKLATGEDDE